MKQNILFIYPPFCSPAAPPYSLINLISFLKINLNSDNYIKNYKNDKNSILDQIKINAIDLNALFHQNKFFEYKNYYQHFNDCFDPIKYSKLTIEFNELTKKTYYENNMSVVKGNYPELLDEMLKPIIENKPKILAISIVYSSQVFYAYSIIKKLKEIMPDVKIIIGGPAVNDKVRQISDACLNNEIELLNYINHEFDLPKPPHDQIICEYPLQFDLFPYDNYFSPNPVIPIKTSNTCYYQKCAFCTHHSGSKYLEYSLKNIMKSIKIANIKNPIKIEHVFFIDDMIHKKRLLEIAEQIKDLNIKWMCQLKPTSDFDEDTLKKLHDSGLKLIIWGVESGSNRILEKMKKGTNIESIQKVISASHKVGIRNAVFIMFGFPTETQDEFMETINFLKNNQDNIDLISTSIFGLQRNSYVYSHPEEFEITKIIESKRTILEPSIEFEINCGLTTKQAKNLRANYKKTFDKINKYPKQMNFLREHLLIIQ